MDSETVTVIEKSRIENVTSEQPTTGCCGGAPAKTKDACCKLDEDKKAEGAGGCGCNTPATEKSGSGCC